MKLRFSGHAWGHMRDRGITKSEVRRVIARPKTIQRGHEPGRHILFRKVEARSLAVVIKPINNVTHIITAWVDLG